MKKQTPESSLVHAVLDLLAAWRIPAWRRNTGAVKIDKRFIRYGQAGMADIWAIGPGGRHIEIELKAPGKKPNAAQLAWLDLLSETGAICLWGDDIDELRNELHIAIFGNTVNP